MGTFPRRSHAVTRPDSTSSDCPQRHISCRQRRVWYHRWWPSRLQKRSYICVHRLWACPLLRLRQFLLVLLWLRRQVLPLLLRVLISHGDESHCRWWVLLNQPVHFSNAANASNTSNASESSVSTSNAAFTKWLGQLPI